MCVKPLPRPRGENPTAGKLHAVDDLVMHSLCSCNPKNAMPSDTKYHRQEPDEEEEEDEADGNEGDDDDEEDEDGYSE